MLYYVLTFFFGFGAARFLVVHHRTDGRHSSTENALKCFFTPWKSHFIEDIVNNQLQEALMTKDVVQPQNQC